MIDSEPSLRIAEGLSGSKLAAYLLTQGWSARPSRVPGISILSKPIPGSPEPAEFILPVAQGFDDETRRVADALRAIEVVESRPMIMIANEVRRAPATMKTSSKARHMPKIGERWEGLAVVEVLEIEIIDGGDGSLVLIEKAGGDRQLLHTTALKMHKYDSR
jgi:hypothetical protein